MVPSVIIIFIGCLIAFCATIVFNIKKLFKC